MRLKEIFDFDTCMITLGLATLVVQWRWQETDASEKSLVPENLKIAGQVIEQPVAPEWEITFPEDSPYQRLQTPAGLRYNPFLEVRNISIGFAGNYNWADKERALDALLAQHAGKDYLFVLQQQVANEMLRRELFFHYYQDPTDENMLEGIAFYTELLIEARSEDTKLLYMCLRALQNHWPKEKKARVAGLTLERVAERNKASAPDTTTAPGYYRQVYARELARVGGVNALLANHSQSLAVSR
ncbi:hypothetical protein [Rufibacter ruber]|uniref:hypothetical protein n=1 Tax=Rufibacter ruber TaxID=1783499 RepID=UPI00082A39B2|nr:hypothetical protein [Rufibacter ruber]